MRCLVDEVHYLHWFTYFFEKKFLKKKKQKEKSKEKTKKAYVAFVAPNS